MQKKVLTVKEFYETTEDLFALEKLGESLDGPLPITVPDIHRPGKVYVTTFGGSVWHGPARGDPHAPEDWQPKLPPRK